LGEVADSTQEGAYFMTRRKRSWDQLWQQGRWEISRETVPAFSAWNRQLGLGYAPRRAPLMSALGHKRTLASELGMSALPPIADIRQRSEYVCFVPETDIQGESLDGDH
jgi:hypothetical protein